LQLGHAVVTGGGTGKGGRHLALVRQRACQAGMGSDQSSPQLVQKSSGWPPLQFVGVLAGETRGRPVPSGRLRTSGSNAQQVAGGLRRAPARPGPANRCNCGPRKALKRVAGVQRCASSSRPVHQQGIRRRRAVRALSQPTAPWRLGPRRLWRTTKPKRLNVVLPGRRRGNRLRNASKVAPGMAPGQPSRADETRVAGQGQQPAAALCRGARPARTGEHAAQRPAAEPGVVRQATASSSSSQSSRCAGGQAAGNGSICTRRCSFRPSQGGGQRLQRRHAEAPAGQQDQAVTHGSGSVGTGQAETRRPMRLTVAAPGPRCGRPTSVTRKRAPPAGTVGGRMAVTSRPRARNILRQTPPPCALSPIEDGLNRREAVHQRAGRSARRRGGTGGSGRLRCSRRQCSVRSSSRLLNVAQARAGGWLVV
jgi:hypothetical protein